MKNLLLVTLMLFLLAEMQPQTLIITKNGNVRSGPSTNYEIIGKVTSGMHVAQIEITGDWIKVKLPDQKTGWIHKILITKEKMTNETGNLIVWEKLVDKHNVKSRILDNKVVFEIVKNDPIWGSGYLVSGEGDSSLKKVLGADSPISTESGTMGVKMFSGTISESTPDSEFYTVLGIGSKIVLPNQWIKIFGIEIKGGSIYIQKSGIRYSQSEIIKDTQKKPVDFIDSLFNAIYNGNEIIKDTQKKPVDFTDSLFNSIHVDIINGNIKNTEIYELSDTLIVFNTRLIVMVSEFISIHQRRSNSNSAESINISLELFINFRLKVIDAIRLKYDYSEEFLIEFKHYAAANADKFKLKNTNLSLENYKDYLFEIQKEALDYYHGLLLFNITDDKVWEPGQNDEIGLKLFCKENNLKYVSDKTKEKKQIISDYQGYLEKEWVKSLKNMYEPVVNDKVFAKIIDEPEEFFSKYNKGEKKDPNFFRETKKNPLLKEAYLRSLYDIRASHILIMVDENASPEDTLAAYNKIVKIRGKVMNGKDFGETAVEYSDDPSASDRQPSPENKRFRPGNRGDLGYFTVFNMVYPFETAAYNTPVGEVSQPVRTKFGYHLVKVTDKRDALGVAEIAHIFVAAPVDMPESERAEKKVKIDNIYAKIQDGTSFDEAVVLYSEDKGSIKNGGKLSKFTCNRVVPEFVVAVENLGPNEISEPVKTIYGYHIIRLVSREKPGTFEEELPTLEEKLAKAKRGK